ncbi:MAG: TetR/AcrR family transcriptional regulator, partial [Deltaproteobacteria bacterium]|nr:TetR/AcrR family transcriptional regulator [Deltaproteobacteria bacterium]
VNISSLHYHWESKETLYYAVFQNIYDRILEVVRRSIPEHNHPGKPRMRTVEAVMGTLFDFFADNPTIPKLLVRRLVENDVGAADIERDILLPAWKVFAGWTQAYEDRKPKQADAQLFMLTVEAVVLFFLLDSRHFTTLLGRSVHQPALRKRVRTYIINLVPLLLGQEE